MITVCFPVYNGEKYISTALEYTIKQINNDNLNVRILISNNHSDDKTFEICKDFAERYDCIKIFNQANKISLIENYNFLLKKVETKYFVFHSHDDVRLDGFYVECFKFLEKQKNIVLCYTHAVYKDEITHKIYREEKCEKMGWGSSLNERFLNTLKNLETCAFHGMYRSASVKKIGLMENIQGSDHFFLNKLSCEGKFFEIEKKLMMMNESSLKWKDGSIENKLKINEIDKTSKYPLTRIFLSSLFYAFKKQKNKISNIKLGFLSLKVFFIFLKNDLLYKKFKSIF